MVSMSSSPSIHLPSARLTIARVKGCLTLVLVNRNFWPPSFSIEPGGWPESLRCDVIAPDNDLRCFLSSCSLLLQSRASASRALQLPNALARPLFMYAILWFFYVVLLGLTATIMSLGLASSAALFALEA